MHICGFRGGALAETGEAATGRASCTLILEQINQMGMAYVYYP
jgi:hypothetical protein